VFPMGFTMGNSAAVTRKIFFASSLNATGIT